MRFFKTTELNLGSDSCVESYEVRHEEYKANGNVSHTPRITMPSGCMSVMANVYGRIEYAYTEKEMGELLHRGFHSVQ